MLLEVNIFTSFLKGVCLSSPLRNLAIELLKKGKGDMLEKVIFRGIIKEVEVATIPCADGAKIGWEF